MTQTRDYSLAVNWDGSIHTKYPLGDKPGISLVPPVNLVASNPTSSSIDLTWDYTGDPVDHMEVAVWITDVSVEWTSVALLSGDARAYTSINLPADANIGHVVRSTIDDTPPLDATTISSIDSISSSQLNVNFDDTVLNAVKYNIQRSENGSIWADLTIATQSPLIDTGLSAGHTYYYRIFTENASGTWGPESNIMSQTTGV